MELNQYQIVLVNLDPTIGSEMKKTRPCAIISPNEMNKYLATITIAPITSNSKSYPTRLKISQPAAGPGPGRFGGCRQAQEGCSVFLIVSTSSRLH